MAPNTFELRRLRLFGRPVIAAIMFCCSPYESVVAVDRPAGDSIINRTAASGASPNTRGAAASSAQRSQQRIQELIRELGSARYAERRAAANELKQIGAEAFDLLHAATNDPDPEVAASANYLLRQIDVRWVQVDDPTTVRAELRQYGQEPEAVRLQRIGRLSLLPDGTGIGALCRIARFERSPLLSRSAAIEIIRPSDGAVRSHLDQDAFERELGTSARTATTWLRQYLTQLRDPATSVAAWRQLVDEEAARLDQNAGETSSEIVSDLMWNLADVYRQLGDQAALAGILDRMIELAGEKYEEISVELLQWLSENKSWEVLDAFWTKHETQLRQGKQSLYFVALAFAEQGKKDLAEQLASAAAELAPQGALDGWQAAQQLEQHNQFDWAVREYHRSIDSKPIEALDSLPARVLLCNLLHDYEHEKEAAELLEPLVKALQNEGRVGQLYAKLREYLLERRVEELPEADEVAGRYHLYRACQYQTEGDYQRARNSLEDAIKFDPKNADVLIAMYRVPESDDKWQRATREKINALAGFFQQRIDEAPNQATNYNQWAWLISNTEGDFPKAVRYSHRSLELNLYGDSVASSYLDTLGRCYYAIGDYKNAVMYERQAIEKTDYMQVMHRQLALFEKALAEKKAAAKSNEGSDKPN